MYALRRRQRECGRKLAVARDVIAADHDVSWADRLLGARNGLAHSHSLLFRGAADAFAELGALRRRRYRGQRTCGGQEEQAAHRCFVVSRVHCLRASSSLAEVVVTCESCTRRDCTKSLQFPNDLSKHVLCTIS